MENCIHTPKYRFDKSIFEKLVILKSTFLVRNINCKYATFFLFNGDSNAEYYLHRAMVTRWN